MKCKMYYNCILSFIIILTSMEQRFPDSLEVIESGMLQSMAKLVFGYIRGT